MVLIFVATLEQVRIGIRGAQAEFFESIYGMWNYPEQFWGGEFLNPLPHSYTWWIFTWRLAHNQPYSCFYYPFPMDREKKWASN